MLELNVTYVDATLTPAAVSEGMGPFLYYYTDEFKYYAHTLNLTVPPYEKRTLKKFLKKYISVHKSMYRYRWVFDKWHLNQIDAFQEAYEESNRVIGDWIYGFKPLFIKDNFIFKQLVKKTMQRLNIELFARNVYRKLIGLKR